MDGRQHIYYALGILCYALARSDGKIHDEERTRLFDIIKRETEHNIDFQYAEIIFQLLEKDHAGKEGIYKWAITELEKARHYLNNDVKSKMKTVLISIADAFDGISEEEMKIIRQFQADLERIRVDHTI